MNENSNGWLHSGLTLNQILFDGLLPVKTDLTIVSRNYDMTAQMLSLMAYIGKGANKKLLETLIPIFEEFHRELSLKGALESHLELCAKTIRQLFEHRESMNKTLKEMLRAYLVRCCIVFDEKYESVSWLEHTNKIMRGQADEELLNTFDGIDWEKLINSLRKDVGNDRFGEFKSSWAYLYGDNDTYRKSHGHYPRPKSWWKSVWITDNFDFKRNSFLKEIDYREQDQKTCGHSWKKYQDADMGRADKCKFCNLICEHNMVERRRSFNALGTAVFNVCSKCGKQ